MKVYFIYLLYISVAQQAKSEVARLIVEVCRSHTISQAHPVGLV
jgi:hypothetical protein